MEAFWVIVWLVSFIFSIGFIYRTVGIHQMVRFFPEGKRWYHFPLQMLSLALFTIAILIHPF